jgi:aryl-alcohol dehydrogenase-like predicted oxidoreductase
MAGGMRRRPLGKTGLEVTELALGTWGLSGEAYGHVPLEEALRTLVRAHAMGITLFETSASYARGALETALGKVLEGKEDVVVVTKLGTDRGVDPPEKCFDPAFLRRSAQTSRERIGKGPKLVALLHNPTRATVEAGPATAALVGLAAEGVIDSWGVSGDDEGVIEAAIAAEAPVVSLAYNILKVQPLRALETRLREAGTGVLLHSVLAYGLLAGRWVNGREFRIGDHRRERFPGNSIKKRIRHLDAVRPLVSGDVINIRAAALCFALASEVASSIVLGPKNSAQLDQLLRDCRGIEPPYLSRPKLDALEQRLIALEVER